MSTLLKIAAAVVVVFIIGFAGEADHQQAVQAEAEYCARVAAGVHTDYDDLCPAHTFNSFTGQAGDVDPQFVVGANQ